MREFSILVVDEDKNCIGIIRKALDRGGRTILAAGSSEEALQITSDSSVNAIILDFCTAMQKESDFTRSMVEWREIRSVPVFMMSCKDDLSVKLMCYISGAAGFFSKPVDLEDLNRCIENIEKKNKKEAYA